jgi:CopG family transcriptional regulator / antitoxin EndoAI
MIDCLVRKAGRSRLIQQAVDHYVDSVGRKRIRRMLIEGGMKHAARDRSLAEEWFAIDESAWENSPR